MNIPSDFVIRTQELLKGEWEAFYDALQSDSPTSIRFNSDKQMNLSEVELNKVSWCENGIYLNERPQFTFDPLFHGGCYYVQEASSMFVQQVLKQYVKDDVNVLDLCAAPGGKSTLLLNSITSNSLLISNEVIRSRANILSENIAKWGKSNAIVTNNDPEKIGKLNHFFDVILVDAPCSGEGMFRKGAQAVNEWSIDNVELCKQRQQRILADIWPALKPNGILIYSTCTYNLDENENNVQWICNELGAETLDIEIEEEWGITPSFLEGISAYRFLPHKTKGEGFFLSAIRKNDDNEYPILPKKKGKKEKLEAIPSEYRKFINNDDAFLFFNHKEDLHSIPKIFDNQLSIVQEHLNIISAGICLGEQKGKDFIPDQSLALSCDLNRDVFLLHDVDWQTAINYLRKETLVLPDLPRGYILLTYKNTPIGFVKNIGNRANNLYPQEWRIRSAHIPKEEVRIL